jgi:hypothetical protein
MQSCMRVNPPSNGFFENTRTLRRDSSSNGVGAMPRYGSEFVLLGLSRFGGSGLECGRREDFVRL